uniref:Uncharacterized protein n=1 Tax=Strigamia maritima TaxID=126957 RepID=T1IPQ7_STRMM
FSFRHIVTCGEDGRLRIWEAPDFDVITTHPIGEKVSALFVEKNVILFSNDTNGIAVISFPELEPEGYLSFLAAPVTRISANRAGTILCAASCDFTIRIINRKEKTYKELKHEAPVLCVDVDPQGKFLLSSSCDGSVCVWNLTTYEKVKSWNGILPKNNSVENSKILGHVAWETVTGKFVVIPRGKEIEIYSRDNWILLHTLKDDRIDADLSVCAASSNGIYVSAGSVNGIVIVWDVCTQKCVNFIQNDKRGAIAGFSWNPQCKEEMAYCDYDGQLHVRYIKSKDNTDNVFSTELPDDVMASFNEPFGDDSDDENTFSISQIKAETVGLNTDDDNTSEFPKQIEPITNGFKTKALLGDDENDIDNFSTVSEFGPSKSSNRNFAHSFQGAFQPGSTPTHLSHRFMAWNIFGFIINHNTEEENSLDIEFHDSTTYHSMHLNNHSNYVLAALTEEAVVFANESEEDRPSMLMCMHFKSWDSNNEWTVNMPSKENIHAVAAGDGWVAVATSQRQLRMFTIGGVQLDTISLPGPVVSMNGHHEYLIVAYHLGAGLPGEQCLATLLLTVLTRKILFSNVSLSLSPQSTLMWIGFSEYGAPACVDSEGIVTVLRQNVGNVWMQVCNTRAGVKGKSDHFFVVALSELQKSVWGLPCKGSKYPPTLPRPIMTPVPLQLPLCELNTEKGQLEESLWHQKLVNDTLIHMEHDNTEHERQKTDGDKALQATLMKAFALACNSDRGYRAVEICELMPTSYAVQLAIKYATAQNHLQLAHRLNEIAYEKSREEINAARNDVKSPVGQIDETDDEFADDSAEEVGTWKKDVQNQTVAKTTAKTPIAVKSNIPVKVKGKQQVEPSSNISDDDSSENEQIEQSPNSPDVNVTRIPQAVPSSNDRNKNPFKKNSNPPKKLIESGKGAGVFDTFTNITSKQKEKNAKKLNPATSKATRQRGNTTKTTFKSWFQTNEEEMRAEYPHLSDKDLKKCAMDKFKETNDKEKQVFIILIMEKNVTIHIILLPSRNLTIQ